MKIPIQTGSIERLVNKNPIITERLIIRLIERDDAQEIYHHFTPEVTRYMYPAPPEKIEDTLNFIRTSQEEMRLNKTLQLVFTRKETGEFIGCGGLHHLDEEVPELGIWIKKEAHFQGLGREGIAGIVEWTWANLPIQVIKYPVDRDNIPSRKIPESLGGKLVDSYDRTNLSGGVLHLVEYRLYKPENP